MSDFMASGSVPALTLTGNEASQYAAIMSRVMRGSRLNSHYPNASGLGGHIGVMSPDVHGGLYADLEVDERTGLPTYKAFTRVQSDSVVAAKHLVSLGDRGALEVKARRDPDGIHAKQLAKYDYYTRLTKADRVPLGEMTVRYRKRDADRDYFNVTLDKLDVSGIFVRYTIDCSQTVKASGQIASVDKHEVAEHTEAFQSLIYQFTSLDAEFTLVKLASMAGLGVERVVKGTVGPMFFPYTTTPDVFSDFVARHGYLASFGLDMAAVDVVEDRINDPFEALVIQRVSDEARLGYKVARERLGYHVFKDRKFVCARASVGELRELIKSLGTSNIVYGV